MSGIEVHQQYPIINGYAQLPPNLEKNKTLIPELATLMLFPGSELVFSTYRAIHKADFIRLAATS